VTGFEPTLVDLVGVQPIANIQLTQIRITVPAATYVPFVVQSVCQPEWVALVESEAGVDNHGDPEGGEEEEEGPVPALAVMANDASSGPGVPLFIITGGGGGIAANNGA